MTDSHTVLVRDAVAARFHDAEPDGTHARHTCRLCGRAGLTATGTFVYGSAVLGDCPGRPVGVLTPANERALRITWSRSLLLALRVAVATGNRGRLPFLRHHLREQREALLTLDAVRSGR